MNQDEISFKSQFILESLAKKDLGFIFNLAHDSDNKVTGIVWMTSYMRDNFERFSDYILQFRFYFRASNLLSCIPFSRKGNNFLQILLCCSRVFCTGYLSNVLLFPSPDSYSLVKCSNFTHLKYPLFRMSYFSASIDAAINSAFSSLSSSSESLSESYPCFIFQNLFNAGCK